MQSSWGAGTSLLETPPVHGEDIKRKGTSRCGFPTRPQRTDGPNVEAARETGGVDPDGLRFVWNNDNLDIPHEYMSYVPKDGNSEGVEWNVLSIAWLDAWTATMGELPHWEGSLWMTPTERLRPPFSFAYMACSRQKFSEKLEISIRRKVAKRW